MEFQKCKERGTTVGISLGSFLTEVPSQIQADKKLRALHSSRAAAQQKAEWRCRTLSEHCWKIPVGISFAAAYLPTNSS